MFSPTTSQRVLVFAYALRARFHPFAAGPNRADVESIEPLSGCDLMIAVQTNTQVDADMGKKPFWMKPRLCWMMKGNRNVGSHCAMLIRNRLYTTIGRNIQMEWIVDPNPRPV